MVNREHAHLSVRMWSGAGGYMWIQASSQTFPAGVVKRTCCQNGGSEKAVLTLMASAD